MYLILMKGEVIKNDNIHRSKSQNGRTPEERSKEILEDL
jgi:hypothetical protein